MLTLNEEEVINGNSIRIIEVLQVDEPTAISLLNPTVVEGLLGYNSLNNVAQVDQYEQYEHLSRLLHIKKLKRLKT